MAQATENARLNIFINTKGAEGSMADLQGKAAKLRAEIRLLADGDPLKQGLVKQLQAVNGKIEEQQLKLQGTSKFWKTFGSDIKSFAVNAIGVLGVAGLVGTINNLIERNAKLSDQFADIRKTTGLSAQGVKELNKELSAMNTRTSTNDLREMAIVAGQLGYNSKDDVLKFVGAMDKLNVALGDEFGSAEEITKVMGGLRSVFTDIRTDNVDQDMLRIGNAVNELSAAGSATAPVVSDFSNRIGGMGITLGLTTGQVLGISAALQEMNIPAERGGTAVVRILQKMTTETEAFAKIAGLSIKEYQHLLNTDLYGALNLVIAKSQEGGKSTTQFAAMMQDAELKAAGASEVFAKWGNNTALVSEKVNLANESLKGTNSIMNEFNIKNENFAANLAKIQKWFASIFVSPGFIKSVEGITKWISDWVGNTEDLTKAIRSEQIELDRAAENIFRLKVGTQERTAAIQQLMNKYPQYLANIDAETISNEDLRKALDKVNDSLINRIVIANKDNEIQEVAKRAAEDQIALLEAQSELENAISNMMQANTAARKKYYELIEAGTDKEYAAWQVRDAINKGEISGMSRANKAFEDLSIAIEKVRVSRNKFNESEADVRLMQSERDRTKALLGIIDTPESGTTVRKRNDGFVDPGKTKEKVNKEYEDAVKAYNDYLDKLAKIDQDYTALKTRLIDDDLHRTLKTNADNYKSQARQLEDAREEQLVKLSKAHDEGILGEQEYNREIIDINRRYNELGVALEDEYLKKQDDTYQKFADKQKQDYEKDTEANLKLLEERNKRVEAAQNEHRLLLIDKGIIQADGEGDADQKLKLEEDKLTAIRDIELQNEQLTVEEKLNIQLRYENDLDRLRQERIDKERQANSQIFSKTIEMLQNTINAAFQIEANNRNANTQFELSSLEKRKQAELRNKNLTEEQKAAIEQKYDEQDRNIKRNAFRAQKEAAIAQAAINGALAVTNILATMPKFDFGVASGIAIGAAAVATAAQIAVIASQPEPGFQIGGFTGAGFDHEPKGLAHANEYVASAPVLRDPVAAPNISALENIRQEKLRGSVITNQVPQGLNNNELINAVLMLGSKLDAWPKQLQVINDPLKTKEYNDTLLEIQNESTL